jgi:hypothetical protein
MCMGVFPMCMGKCLCVWVCVYVYESLRVYVYM